MKRAKGSKKNKEKRENVGEHYDNPKCFFF
jgi:hypothetical protein